jgi:hypothetical protein
MESRTKINLLLLEYLSWDERKYQRNIIFTKGEHFNAEMARHVFQGNSPHECLLSL